MTVRLEELTKRFDGAGPAAVDRVSLTIETGEILALVGESGCGKTTLLKMVNRLVESTSGLVLLDGKDTSTLDPVELRRSIGFVFQEAALFPHMTVAANVGLTPSLLGWTEQRIAERTDLLLDLVNLPKETFAGRYPSELSGGQRQRVGFSRALAASPSLLLLDEPFGALDPLTRDLLQTEFQSLQAKLGFTAMITTHDMAEALLLADRIAVMRAGKVIALGTPSELLRMQPDNEESAYVVELLATPRRSVDRIAALTEGDGA